MLNLNMLRIFHAVAEHNSVVGAADSLFISQPAVSNAIKKMQNEYEVSLFYREGRHLRLTEEGKNLYKFSQQIFDISRQAETYLEQLKTSQFTQIRVGLVSLYERYFVDNMVNIFHELDPSLSVSIVSGNSKTVLKMLLRGDVDISINAILKPSKSLRNIFYKRHKVFVYAPQNHEFYGKKTFRAQDLNKQRMIYKEDGSAVRQASDAYIERYSIKPTAIIELSNFDAIMDLAYKEKCLCFLPEISGEFKNDRDEKSFLDAEEGDLFFDVFFSFLPNHRYSPAQLGFFNQLYKKLSDKN